MLDLAHIAEASFQELLAASLDYAGRGEQMNAAGVQSKISAAMISLPLETPAGAYLLKLEPADYPRIIQNEAFFMAAARDAGLPTADVSVVTDREGAAGLLVRRFDRKATTKSRTAEKLHVEDGCQLLDRYPADKYAVSMSDLARVVSEHSSTPILDVAMLVLRRVVNQAIRRGLSAQDPPRRRHAALRGEPFHSAFRAGVDPLKLNQLVDDLEVQDRLGAR